MDSRPKVTNKSKGLVWFIIVQESSVIYYWNKSDLWNVLD